MSIVFRPSDAQQLYERLSRLGENPCDDQGHTHISFQNFTRRLTGPRRELRNLIAALESQQTGIRIASGVTGTTTLVGIGLSFLFPPVGLTITAFGGAGYLGAQFADVGLNTIHDARLQPLLDLRFDNEVSSFLNRFGIDNMSIESFREIRDAQYNAVGSLWPEILSVTATIQNAANGPLADDLRNLRGT